MKEINVSKVRDAVAELCIEANKVLPDDITCAIEKAKLSEENPLAKEILNDLCKNCQMAKELDVPVCQDTGMAVVFLKIGQDVHFVGGNLNAAVNEGVKIGYEKGLLRKSVVSDPINRVNTGDNTPAVIHLEIVDGDEVEITVAPKGFGSENMSKIYMLTPFDSRKGVVDSVLDCVKKASGNPCPPIVVGVGIGGDFEQCALLSKKALCRDTSKPNENPFYKELEEELLNEINKTGIGPQGFGGVTTALAVNIETAPTHIAGLPVAVNIGCHVTRHKTKRI
jgi:fumarate hydratase subunit alpha